MLLPPVGGVAGRGGGGRETDCRVQGPGSRVQGSEFRVQGSGFRVQGSGFRVHLEKRVIKYFRYLKRARPEEKKIAYQLFATFQYFDVNF